MRRALAVTLTAVLLGGTACTDTPVSGPRQPVETTGVATPSTDPTTEEAAAPRRFEADRAMATVRDLAGGIGPRPATSPAFRTAAAYVADAFAAQGYAVRREPFRVPGGDSWGVPVGPGRSLNVVAEPPHLDRGAPYVLVGAHLDTVAVAPGAEDNASGVAVLLEIARVLAAEEPVVLVAFGGEEPVGDGHLHHFGSKHQVAGLSAADRRNLRAMVSLDRVGVGSRVPIGFHPGTSPRVAEDLAAAARRVGIDAVVGTSTTSDHESFAVEGLPAARIGGTDYDAYHSTADRPAGVDPAQLSRVGRLLIAWLRGS